MPNISKRGDKYRIVISLGYDVKGKQIRKTTTFTPPENVSEGKALKLAEQFAYSYEEKLKGATSLDENKRFVDICEWYFTSIAPNILKPRTLFNQRGYVDLYITPAIGNVKLKDINTIRIDSLFGQLSKDGSVRKVYSFKDTDIIPKGKRKVFAKTVGIAMDRVLILAKGGAVSRETADKIFAEIKKTKDLKFSQVFTETKPKAGLTKRTILTIKHILSAIFTTAVKKGIVLKNPIDNTTVPKGEEKERPHFGREDTLKLAEIFENIEDIQIKTMLTTLLYTGFRSGELLGLMWDDINHENRTISVKRTLSRVGSKYALGTTKTKKSQRLVEVPREIIDLIVNQKKERDRLFSLQNITPVDDNMVFLGKNGGYVNNCYLNTTFKKLLKKNGLPDCHIHDIRHAHASLLINSGIPAVQIAAQLGHASPKTTEEIYAHAYEEYKTNINAAVTRGLLKDSKNSETKH